MSTVYDLTVMKKILAVTCSILKDNFFYDKETLKPFVSDLSDELVEQLQIFEEHANPNVVAQLKIDSEARIYFTCYFVSTALQKALIDGLNFTEQELHAFESILPSYTGELRYNWTATEKAYE